MLAAVARDLRRGFGERYRILRAALGRGGAGDPARAARARRPGRDADRRPADAGHAGHATTCVEARKIVPDAKRVLLTAYADTEAAIAGDQRGRARLLPAEAVGPARGAAVPGRRGSADDVGGGRRARGRRRARDRPPLLEGVARPARLPRAQPRPGALARRRARRARRASCCRSRASTPTACRSRCSRTAPVLERPTRARAGRAARRRRRSRRQDHYDLVDRRRRPGRPGGGGLRRLGGAEDGHGRARGAGRPGRAVEPDRELPRASRPG